MTTQALLEAIYAEHGQLTPALVVDVARPAVHPLHARFEWDDSVAGEAWRRTQAHALIRSVRVVVAAAADGGELSVRAFHAVAGPSGHVFEPTARVVDDPLLRALVLRDMEREWRQLRQRYEQFQEFIAMVQRDLTAAA